MIKIKKGCKVQLSTGLIEYPLNSPFPIWREQVNISIVTLIVIIFYREQAQVHPVGFVPQM